MPCNISERDKQEDQIGFAKQRVYYQFPKGHFKNNKLVVLENMVVYLYYNNINNNNLFKKGKMLYSPSEETVSPGEMCIRDRLCCMAYISLLNIM